MNKAITIELQFFLISILWGSILLFVYDGLRILRRLVKHNEIFLAVEDLIFWVVSSLFIFAMMYQENNGIIRGFSVVGMAIGMILYHYILSELLVKVITKFIYTLFRPVIIAFNGVKKMLHFILSKVKKIMKFLLLRLNKITKSVKIALNKRKIKKTLKRNLQKEKKVEEKKKEAQKKLMAKNQKEEQANQRSKGNRKKT